MTMTTEPTADAELIRDALHQSTCFGRDVCSAQPCACAEEIAAARLSELSRAEAERDALSRRLADMERRNDELSSKATRALANCYCLSECRAGLCVKSKKCMSFFPGPGSSYFQCFLDRARAVLALSPTSGTGAKEGLAEALARVAVLEAAAKPFAEYLAVVRPGGKFVTIPRQFFPTDDYDRLEAAFAAAPQPGEG